VDLQLPIEQNTGLDEYQFVTLDLSSSEISNSDSPSDLLP